MNRWAGLVAALILGAFGIGVTAQQAAPLQTELLAEVRLLRQSIEALAGTNARVQIVFGRLQLQEQRTATATARLDQARLDGKRLAWRLHAAREDSLYDEDALRDFLRERP